MQPKHLVWQLRFPWAQSSLGESTPSINRPLNSSWQKDMLYCAAVLVPLLHSHDLASLGMWLVMGTLRDLAANRMFLKRERSEPLGRAKPKLMREMAFSHSVFPSGPLPVDSLSALCRFSLERCPLVVLRFCTYTPQHECDAWPLTASCRSLPLPYTHTHTLHHIFPGVGCRSLAP